MADWASAGLQSNPVANTILAEQVAAGDNARKWKLMVSAGVACVVIIEHRNAANDATVPGHSQGFFVPANGSIDVCSDIAIPIFDGERLRVRLNATIAGGVWASVLVE